MKQGCADKAVLNDAFEGLRRGDFTRLLPLFEIRPGKPLRRLSLAPGLVAKLMRRSICLIVASTPGGCKHYPIGSAGHGVLSEVLNSAPQFAETRGEAALIVGIRRHWRPAPWN